MQYTQDPLKVDVNVRETLMEKIKSDVRAGQLDADDFLTASFEIPGVRGLGGEIVMEYPKMSRKADCRFW